VYELRREKVAQSIIQNMQPIPSAQEVTMYSWNTTEGIHSYTTGSVFDRQTEVCVYLTSIFVWFLPVAGMCVCVFKNNYYTIIC
jgi:hypothetical protein